MEINRQREKSAHHFMSLSNRNSLVLVGGLEPLFHKKVTTSGPAVSSLVSNLVALPARWWRCDAANRPAGRGPPTHAHSAAAGTPRGRARAVLGQWAWGARRLCARGTVLELPSADRADGTAAGSQAAGRHLRAPTAPASARDHAADRTNSNFKREKTA